MSGAAVFARIRLYNLHMTAPTSVKQELHELIESLSAEDAAAILDYINMRLDPDELTLEEEEAVLRVREERKRGETTSHEDLKRELGL
jgi:tetrahydromethanopterin S-methyltransferase subunit A